MHRICGITTLAVYLSVTLGVASSWAQRPTGNDVSDTMTNTGGGTGALTSITTGSGNTAYGTSALQSTTSGGVNTASETWRSRATSLAAPTPPSDSMRSAAPPAMRTPPLATPR